MKRVLLFLMITGLTTMLAFGQTRETRSVSGFSGINASGVFDITVTKDRKESLSIEGDESVIPYVRSEVHKDVLHLYIDNATKMMTIKALKASVVMKNLDNVTLSGACKLTTEDLFTPEKFKADCSGASKLDVNLNTGQLNIEASGASKIGIQADITGDADLDVSGASKISADMRVSNVRLNSGGVCSIELTGSASTIKIDVSGTSKIKAGDFTVTNATVISSGTSAVTVNATDSLKINSSGAASVNYKGSPVLNLNKTQAVKVTKI